MPASNAASERSGQPSSGRCRRKNATRARNLWSPSLHGKAPNPISRIAGEHRIGDHLGIGRRQRLVAEQQSAEALLPVAITIRWRNPT